MDFARPPGGGDGGASHESLESPTIAAIVFTSMTVLAVACLLLRMRRRPRHARRAAAG